MRLLLSVLFDPKCIKPRSVWFQELNTSSMVNVAWALAKTDYAGAGNRRTRTLLDNIAKSAMIQMDCFTPEQLSRLLWAFSTLRHYHAELCDAVAAETLRQV